MTQRGRSKPGLRYAEGPDRAVGDPALRSTSETGLGRRVRIGCLALLALAGCHPDPPPEHLAVAPLSHVPAEIHELARRAALIHTVGGSGVLNLTGKDGKGVVLDVAVALAPPDKARVRAYKFGRAVFDLTATPAGTYVTAGDDRSTAAGATAAQVARGLSLLTGTFFNDPALAGTDAGDELVLTRPGTPTVVCHVERATLVPRRFEMLDDAGHVRFTLTLDAYQPGGGGALWPRRVTADSDAGRAVVTLDDADVNGDLPAAAFDPPAGSRRLP